FVKSALDRFIALELKALHWYLITMLFAIILVLWYLALRGKKSFTTKNTKNTKSTKNFKYFLKNLRALRVLRGKKSGSSSWLIPLPAPEEKASEGKEIG